MRQRARPGFVWESQPGGRGPPGLADGRCGGHSAGEKPPAQGAPRGPPGAARGAPPFCSAASQPRAGVVVFELLICSRAKLEGQGKKGHLFLLLAREARGRARSVNGNPHAGAERWRGAGRLIEKKKFLKKQFMDSSDGLRVSESDSQSGEYCFKISMFQVLFTIDCLPNDACK